MNNKKINLTKFKGKDKIKSLIITVLCMVAVIFGCYDLCKSIGNNHGVLGGSTGRSAITTGSAITTSSAVTTTSAVTTNSSIYQSRRVYKDGQTVQADKYHTGKKELEEYFNAGYTIQEIYAADEIGNMLDIEPKTLLERARKESKDLYTIEQEIMQEKINGNKDLTKNSNLLKSFSVNKSMNTTKSFITNTNNDAKIIYTDSLNELYNSNLSDEEISTLSKFIDANEVSSVKELIKEYKSRGEEALKGKIKPKSKVLSNEKMKQYNLSVDEAKGLSDEIIQKMEKISSTTKVPVKELINAYHKELQKEGVIN